MDLHAHFCRVCLKPSLEYIDFEMSFTDGNNKEENLTYLECFEKCTQIQIESNKEYLCEGCAKELTITYYFLMRAKKSEKILNIVKNKKVNEMETGNKHDGLVHLSLEIDSNNDYLTSALYEISTKTDIDDDDDDNKTIYEYLEDTEDVVNEKVELYENETEDFGDINKIKESKDIENSVIHSDNIIAAYSNEEIDVSAKLLCMSCDILFDNELEKDQHQCKVSQAVRKCDIVSTGEKMNKQILIKPFSKVKCFFCDYKDIPTKVVEHERSQHINLAQKPRSITSKETIDLNCIQISDQISSKAPNVQSSIHYDSKAINRPRKHLPKSDSCKICGNKFSTQTYLRQHMNVHIKNRNLYKCEYCSRVYLTKPSLENHLRLHEGTALKCKICGKLYSRSHEFKIHMRFHNRDFPFQCTICFKKFAIKGHLRSHMWLHDGIKIQCNICGKLFTSTKSLNEHIFLHTGMPFQCYLCYGGYPSKHKMRQHFKIVHYMDVTDDDLDAMLKRERLKPIVRKKLTLVQAYNDHINNGIEFNETENEEHLEEYENEEQEVDVLCVEFKDYNDNDSDITYTTQFYKNKLIIDRTNDSSDSH